MKRKQPIVAIDGPVGVGKSTVARELARRMGYLYIDTGAMYRAITLKAMRKGIDLNNKDAVTEMLDKTKLDLERRDGNPFIYCDGEDVSEEIRLPEVSAATSAIADNEKVRERLVAMQQEMGKNGGVVMEGRDISTVVFPDAEIKLFMVADPKIRAQRRYEELRSRGKNVTYEETLDALMERDNRDQSRKVGALAVSKDAIVVDTSRMTLEQVIEHLIELAKSKIPA